MRRSRGGRGCRVGVGCGIVDPSEMRKGIEFMLSKKTKELAIEEIYFGIDAVDGTDEEPLPGCEDDEKKRKGLIQSGIGREDGGEEPQEPTESKSGRN